MLSGWQARRSVAINKKKPDKNGRALKRKSLQGFSFARQELPTALKAPPQKSGALIATFFLLLRHKIAAMQLAGGDPQVEQKCRGESEGGLPRSFFRAFSFRA